MYAKVESRAPHFMGVPGGAQVWTAVRPVTERLLQVENEQELIDHLTESFKVFGR